MIFTAGSTNKSVYFYIVQDASATSPGEPVTGLLFSDIETGGSASYARLQGPRVDLTLITLAAADAAHADGGFILVDDTNMPGFYRCDYPDAAFATGAGVDQVFCQIVVASGKNAVAAPVLVDLTNVDLRDAVRAGLTALPNAAADAAGGLPISDAGGLDLDDIPITSEFEARTLVAAGYFDASADDVTLAAATHTGAVIPIVSVLTDHTAQTGDSFAIVDDSVFGNSALNDTLSQIANVGAAINVSAIAAPNGFTLTTGSEVNDEDATAPLDGTRHELTDAAGTLDAIYKFDIGGDAAPVSVTFTGIYNGNNDSWDISGNTGTDATPVWVQIGTLAGSNIASDVVRPFNMFSNMIVSDIIGQVQIRVNGTGLTSSSFDTDQVFVSKSSTSRSVGYANGQIWVDTNNGVAGTESFVNGVADSPVLTWADALTLSAAIGITDFHVVNGSAIQLSASSDNFSIFGDNWTLDVNAQSVAGGYFQGAMGSGVGTSATEVHYEGCDIATMSVQIGHFDFCSFSGTVTHTLAGDYNYHNCYSKVAGVGGPTFTKTAGQAITAQWRNWAGSITVSGIQAGDVMTISGEELGDVVLNGAEGTVKILGQYESLTDNRTGSPTLVEGGFEGSDVTDILADTADMQPKLGAPAADVSADIAAVKAETAAILTDTGTTLPALIDDLAVKKNATFSNFEFLMVLTSDHITPATGLTVTGQRSIDGAAFAGVTGTIAEVSNGIYQFDAVAADTNGDVITWRFSSATADDTFVTFKTVA